MRPGPWPGGERRDGEALGSIGTPPRWGLGARGCCVQGPSTRRPHPAHWDQPLRCRQWGICPAFGGLLQGAQPSAAARQSLPPATTPGPLPLSLREMPL